jgi:putative phosphoesterase
MKIGIISDTHSILPGSVFDIFRDVSHIFHAGDIGNQEIIHGLEIIAPVHAVYGNVDTWPLVIKYPDMYLTTLQNRRICLIHDIIKPKYFSYQLFKKNIEADIIIHGHTHVAHTEFFRNCLYINPGSASKPRGRQNGTVAILDLSINQLKPTFIEIKEKTKG